MLSVAIVLATAAAALGLARWRGISAIPLLIAGGLVLNVTNALASDGGLRDLLLLGVTFLVFVVGAELDPRRVGDQRRAAVIIGLGQFVLLGAIGLGGMRLLGVDWLTAAYVALAITASSTLLGVTLLRQRQQFFEPVGRLVVGVLLVQDLLVILLLPALMRATDGAGPVLLALLGTLGLMGLAGVCAKWVAPWLILRLRLEQESLLLTILAMLFLFVGAAYWLKIPMVTGAFLAGLSLSRFPIRGLVRGQLTSLADFFLAVFFVALGALVTFPGPQELLAEGLVLLAILALAPPVVMLLARYAGSSTRSAIETGHMLAQCGEFGIVVALLGVQAGHIAPKTLSIIVMVSVVTMGLTPLLTSDWVTWRIMHILARLRRPPVSRHRDHVLFLGCGAHMAQLIRRLRAAGHEVLAVDDDALAVQRAKEAGAIAIRGDGADLRILRAAQARHARVIISTMRRIEDNQRLLQFASGPRVLVRVFSPTEAEIIRDLGGEPIVESEAVAERFFAWIDQTHQPTGAAAHTPPV
jgi:CPA2 family monovalent cation:H+ antiporter-2